jgi:hypothetical protein
MHLEETHSAPSTIDLESNWPVPTVTIDSVPALQPAAPNFEAAEARPQRERAGMILGQPRRCHSPVRFLPGRRPRSGLQLEGQLSAQTANSGLVQAQKVLQLSTMPWRQAPDRWL